MVRVVSWNLNNRGITGAQMQGELLRELRPDLMLLQEVNLGSAETLRQAAEADWLICAADLRQRAADDRPARSQGVAIAGVAGPRRELPMLWMAGSSHQYDDTTRNVRQRARLTFRRDISSNWVRADANQRRPTAPWPPNPGQDRKMRQSR
jgi:hypothetical protein